MRTSDTIANYFANAKPSNPINKAERLLLEAQREIRRLEGVAGRAKGDINWMLNSRKFLHGSVFNYLDEFEIPK